MGTDGYCLDSDVLIWHSGPESAGTCRRTSRLSPSAPCCAERAGGLVRELRARGETLGLGDALIAATCLIHRFLLVTLNVRHFSKVAGLEIEVVPAA